MGAWGHEIFDNDAACDWLDSLLVRDDLSSIELALDKVNQSADSIDTATASAALAACETLARLRGRPGLHEASLDQLKHWTDHHNHLDTDHLVPLAMQTLARIQADDCQLKQQWQQSENFEKWVATVEDVARRIG
ncbi:hypothetical protein C5Y96_13745 [Blastopirellula marina]|uniref:DUF4259 domain-containing protein n=1 Tax=Blastopirellula marina TaxID=124 RepID=A0A2S8FGV4_9BACT|nr:MULTISPECIES: DUF4259 domain-containing protein [Pirellulaceae]PQO31397.1 hypothetical protein C5Y96_13745 [Blastopirellula marina]RCS51791.1 DUF4259 domain-containing protein [Bremerella cremea]